MHRVYRGCFAILHLLLLLFYPNSQFTSANPTLNPTPHLQGGEPAGGEAIACRRRRWLL
ncbi:hypothetical protein Taro_047892 [Colocasia esculenta]|uniref:Uncharacterized protein n=1 Tax=Colocasia esculenta TaxID=4460 RepID=A0A843X717_COLES|nr:hypothetical protein [Colocasia esculenta]